MPDIWLLAGLLFIAAALYASVGHGGASAYLAIMALLSVPADQMRPTALVLNLCVSTIAFSRFARAGAFDRRLFLLVALPAVPMAFLGGGIAIPATIYRPLVGIVLLASAALLAFRVQRFARVEGHPVAPAVALPVGAGLGLLAGLTGTGGGIFLSPLILFAGWADARRTAGVAAAFIFVNSAAGLLGNVRGFGHLPSDLPWLVLAVVLGGALGSGVSATRLPRTALLRLLAVVLVIAGLKLILG